MASRPPRVCLKCGQNVLLVKDGLECILCRKPIHLFCAEGKFDADEAAKLRKSDNGSCYICLICKQINKANSLSIIDTISDSGAAHIAQEKDLIVKKKDEEIAELKKQVVESKSIVKDFERKLVQVMKNNTTSGGGSGKRPRTDDDIVPGGSNQNDLSTLENKITTLMTEKMNQMFNRFESSINETMKNFMHSFGNKTKIDETEMPYQHSSDSTRASRSISRRNRQESRIRSPSHATTVHRPLLTFAEALAKNNTPVDCIRNLEIHGKTQEEKDAIISQLKMDKICINDDIKSIKTKGRNHITVTCNSTEAAGHIETKIKSKYKEAISVKHIIVRPPQIKITRIIGALPQPADIIKQLYEQNHWLLNTPISVSRTYEIRTPKLNYNNIILNCDLATQHKFISRKFVIFGFCECRVHEETSILQCFRCFRYGHMALECNYIPTCKHCDGAHESKSCIEKDIPTRKHCSNCHRANLKGAAFSTGHSVTDERCPIRLDRIDALKKFFVSKNLT